MNSAFDVNRVLLSHFPAKPFLVFAGYKRKSRLSSWSDPLSTSIVALSSSYLAPLPILWQTHFQSFYLEITQVAIVFYLCLSLFSRRVASPVSLWYGFFKKHSCFVRILLFNKILFCFLLCIIVLVWYVFTSQFKFPIRNSRFCLFDITWALFEQYSNREF